MNESQISGELVVAILAIVVALGSLVASWIKAGQANRTAASSSQTAKYALRESKKANKTAKDANTLAQRLHEDAGGRVFVQMNTAAYEPMAGVGTLHRNEHGKFQLDDRVHPKVELCQVAIENPGRTGVTVTEVSLRIEGTKAGYRAVGPRSFVLSGFGAHEAVGRSYFRLEPYDRKTLLLDYWSVVDEEFTNDPTLQEVTIFAEVRVAGHKQPFTSVEHGIWRIRREDVSAVGNRRVRRPRDIILTHLLRHHFSDLADINHLDDFAVTIEETSSLEWNRRKLHEHLEYLVEAEHIREMIDTPIRTAMLSLTATQEYNRLGSQVQPLPVPDARTRFHERRDKEWKDL